MATRHQVLETTAKYIDGLIKQLTPDPEAACVAAFEQLGPLVKKSRAMTADDISTDAYFAEGIQSVINRLDAVRNGFARTYEQENGVSKAEGLKSITKDMSPAEFVAFAATTIRKAIKCAELGYVGKALNAIRQLESDIHKAESFADTTANSITVTVENDPMKVVSTEGPGTVTPAGTSSPSSAASNYVTNPTGVSAPPPATVANTATGSMASQSSNQPAGTSNFVAKDGAEPAAAAATPAAPAPVEPVVVVEPVTVVEPVVTPAEVAKADDVTIAKGLDEIQDAVAKADPDAAQLAKDGWPLDLASGRVCRERF
jgi:hypothetical protein